MKKLFLTAFLILIIVIGFALVSSTHFCIAQSENAAVAKISGYILDFNGHGIAGAEIIFGVPLIIPSVHSDYSGHYVISAPAGIYHINVWPPFNSNFIYYDEPALVVGSGSDITKNITLIPGYKVSGYIADSSGTPVSGAIVGLNLFTSGYYSNYLGYYFVSAPAGTYKLTATPKIGPNFTVFSENNFVVNGNVVRNITVSIPAATPAPTPTATPASSQTPTPTSTPNATSSPTLSPSQTPTTSPSATPSPTNSTSPSLTPTPTNTSNPMPTPSPTSTPTLPSTLISIAANVQIPEVGTTVNVNGRLSDKNGNPLKDKIVILSCAVEGSASWFQMGSGKTNAAGEYSIQWVVGASGTFTLKTEWSGDADNPAAQNSTTLSFLPYQNQKVFFFESNSTVTGLSFNSTSLRLEFSVSGPDGTKGCTKATIAKTLAPNFTGITVYLDGKKLNSIVTSSNDYWIVAFSYSHSIHQITINLSEDAQVSAAPETPVPEFPSWLVLVAIAVLTTIASLFIRKRYSSLSKG